MGKNLVLFAHLVLVFLGLTTHAMTISSSEVLTEPPKLHPVACLRKKLELSINMWRNEISTCPQNFEHERTLQECIQQVELLQNELTSFPAQNNLNENNVNICEEINTLFDLIKSKLQIIERQVYELPEVNLKDSVITSRRRSLIAQLLAEEQKVQHSLHTLFNILGDRNYHLMLGVLPEEGDSVVNKQICKNLLVAFCDKLLAKMLNELSESQVDQTHCEPFTPGPRKSLIQRATYSITTLLEKNYTQAMIGSARQKVNEAKKLVEGTAVSQNIQSMHDSLQRLTLWLTYHLAGILRAYGFGYHNSIPLFVGDLVQQLGLQDESKLALKVLANGQLLLDKPWLRRLAISRMALWATRRFESIMMTAVQPSPQNLFGKLKRWAAKGCSGIFSLVVGGRNLQEVQKFMAGEIYHAPGPENAVMIPFVARKQAPQLMITNNGTDYKVFMGGTNQTTAITIERNGRKAVVEASREKNLAANRGINLEVASRDGTYLYSLEGDSHPLFQVVNQSEGPAIKILGARSRRIKIEQQGSIADYIATIRKFRERPLPRMLSDELFYQLNEHAASIRNISNKIRDLETRQLTPLCENVNNPILRQKLQTMADQWHHILADQ